MNKFLILIFASFLFGCSRLVNDCGEVHTKYIEDDEYSIEFNPLSSFLTQLQIKKYVQMAGIC